MTWTRCGRRSRWISNCNVAYTRLQEKKLRERVPVQKHQCTEETERRCSHRVITPDLKRVCLDVGLTELTVVCGSGKEVIHQNVVRAKRIVEVDPDLISGEHRPTGAWREVKVSKGHV